MIEEARVALDFGEWDVHFPAIGRRGVGCVCASVAVALPLCSLSSFLPRPHSRVCTRDPDGRGRDVSSPVLGLQDRGGAWIALRARPRSLARAHPADLSARCVNAAREELREAQGRDGRDGGAPRDAHVLHQAKLQVRAVGRAVGRAGTGAGRPARERSCASSLARRVQRDRPGGVDRAAEGHEGPPPRARARRGHPRPLQARRGGGLEGRRRRLRPRPRYDRARPPGGRQGEGLPVDALEVHGHIHPAQVRVGEGGWGGVCHRAGSNVSPSRRRSGLVDVSEIPDPHDIELFLEVRSKCVFVGVFVGA